MMCRPFPPSRTWAPVPGKVYQQPLQLVPELVSAGLSPVVNGGAVYMQGPHNETLSLYCVHCYQRIRGKK